MVFSKTALKILLKIAKLIVLTFSNTHFLVFRIKFYDMVFSRDLCVIDLKCNLFTSQLQIIINKKDFVWDQIAINIILMVVS